MVTAAAVRIYGDSITKGTIIDEGYHYHTVIADSLRRFGERFNLSIANRSRFGMTIDRGCGALCGDEKAAWHDCFVSGEVQQDKHREACRGGGAGRKRRVRASVVYRQRGVRGARRRACSLWQAVRQTPRAVV